MILAYDANPGRIEFPEATSTTSVGVCTENLNPDVMVMKSAEDRA